MPTRRPASCEIFSSLPDSSASSALALFGSSTFALFASSPLAFFGSFALSLPLAVLASFASFASLAPF
jgi:hypothetical protein